MSLVRLKKIPFKSLAFYMSVALFISLTFSKTIMEICFFGLLLTWSAGRFTKQIEGPLPFSKNIWLPLALFFALVILSAFFSEIPKNSVRGIFKIFKQIAIFVMISDLMKEQTLMRKFEKFFLFTAWLVLLSGLCQYTFGRDFLRWKAGEASGAGIRVSASFGSYGMLGAFLILTVSYVVSLGFYYHKQVKSFSQTMLASLTASGLALLLFLTRSRGALLALFAGIGLTLLFRKKFLFIFILFLSAGALVLSLPKSMVIHLDADLKEQSIVERFYLWDRAVHVIRAKPLLGTGINTYASTHAKYDQTNNWRVRNYYAHNGYLQLAAETGIPCLLTFLWFLGVCLSENFKSLKSSQPETRLRVGLLIGLLSFLAFSAVDTALQSPQPVLIFWFLLGIYLAYAQRLAGAAAKE